jgi:hypothetical protein
MAQKVSTRTRAGAAVAGRRASACWWCPALMEMNGDLG